ncbi:hypothetical protein [Sphaerisporangium sp. TRM90804]|uniref:hypothetical protein n=1 Tax=Sphaerisporangium sp. TRM90804 TaxID=3031113 RepID=UPI00244A891A|nr:hypothetical protein [Sphaerisporangium sp. TRM90804]MDH2429290.1 hypothetical protein [Sphaerisporangium sp. TRM90804]
MAKKDPLDALDESTARYRETEAAHEESRQAVAKDVVAALKAGKRPTDVVAHSPFTDAYVRKIARDNDIAPAPRGGGKKPK